MYGRALRQGDTQLLISLTDHFGFSGAVSAMLLGYCLKIGHSAPNYISAVAKNWAEEEITTVELASAKIRALERQNTVEERLRREMGINTRFTAKMRNFLNVWLNEWGFDEDMIMLAYEKTVDRIHEWKPEYANKILENWRTAGLRTPEAVEKSEDEYRQSAVKKSPAAAPTAESSINYTNVISQLKSRYKNNS